MFEPGYGGRYPVYPYSQDAWRLPSIAEHSGYFGIGVGLDLLHRSRPSSTPPPPILALAQTQPATDWQALVAQADEAMQRGDDAAAAPRLMELYQRTANPVWLCDAGEAQRRQFAWAAAREAFTRCLAAAPQTSDAPVIHRRPSFLHQRGGGAFGARCRGLVYFGADGRWTRQSAKPA